MENILLNNGQTVLIASEKDIVETIATHLSYELAEKVETLLDSVTENNAYIADLERDLKRLEEENKSLQMAIESMEK